MVFFFGVPGCDAAHRSALKPFFGGRTRAGSRPASSHAAAKACCVPSNGEAVQRSLWSGNGWYNRRLARCLRSFGDLRVEWLPPVHRLPLTLRLRHARMPSRGSVELIPSSIDVMTVPGIPTT